jgi:hypothetical protein
MVMYRHYCISGISTYLSVSTAAGVTNAAGVPAIAVVPLSAGVPAVSLARSCKICILGTRSDILRKKNNEKFHC